jgi:hypothetical protein
MGKFFVCHGRKESDPELDPDPLVRGTYTRIRIHTKMPRIPNTDDRSSFASHFEGQLVYVNLILD